MSENAPPAPDAIPIDSSAKEFDHRTKEDLDLHVPGGTSHEDVVYGAIPKNQVDLVKGELAIYMAMTMVASGDVSISTELNGEAALFTMEREVERGTEGITAKLLNTIYNYNVGVPPQKGGGIVGRISNAVRGGNKSTTVSQ